MRLRFSRRFLAPAILAAVALILLTAVVLLVTADPADDSGSIEVQRSIRRYTELLAAGYANLNMNPLTEVATLEQAQQEYYHMAALGEGGVKLAAVLEAIEFDSVSVEATTAVAVTEELWAYTQVSTSTDEAVARNRVRYSLRYDLVLERGRWLVADVTAFDSVDVPIEESTLPTNAVPFERPEGEEPGLPRSEGSE